MADPSNQQALLLGAVAHVYNSSSQNSAEAEKSLEVQGQFGLQNETQDCLGHNVFKKVKHSQNIKTKNKPILWSPIQIYPR